MALLLDAVVDMIQAKVFGLVNRDAILVMTHRKIM
jgi:hypothetical protein